MAGSDGGVVYTTDRLITRAGTDATTYRVDWKLSLKGCGWSQGSFVETVKEVERKEPSK